MNSRLCALRPYGPRDYTGTLREGDPSHRFLVEVLGSFANATSCKYIFNGYARIQGRLVGLCGSHRAGAEDCFSLMYICRVLAAGWHFHLLLHQRIAALGRLGLGPLGHLRFILPPEDLPPDEDRPFWDSSDDER